MSSDETLAVSHSPLGAEALLGALVHADWRVRREGVQALERSAEREVVIERLLDRVLSEDIDARTAALDALRALHAAATPHVIARLEKATGPRRRFLVEALLEGVTPECLPVILALLGDADPNVPPAAIEVAAALRDGSAVPVLVAALAHRDPVVRIGALIALQSRAELVPVESLVLCVRDPLTVRVALSLIVARPEPAAFEAVLECIERGDRHSLTAAIRACDAIGRSGDRALRARLVASSQRWLPAVLSLAADRRVELVTPAIWMLGHASTLAAAEAVLGAFGHPQATVRAAAEVALDVLMTHAPFVALSASAAMGAGLRRAVIGAIASAPAIAGDDVLDALTEAMDDPAVGVEALQAVAAHATPARHEAVWRGLLRAVHRSPDREDLGAVASSLFARSSGWAVDEVDRAFVVSPAGLSVALAWVRAGGSLDAALVDASLASNDPVVLTLGLRLVGALGSPRWAEVCGAHLAVPALRGDAIAAIRACGVEAEVLIGWLSDRRPGHRLTAVLSLAERSLLPTAAAVRLLDDADPEVALSALHALGAAVPRAWLHGLMRQGDPVLAQEALATICASDSSWALEMQLEALGHEHASVRSLAVASLDTGSQDVRARLYVRLAEERDPEVAMGIERILKSRAAG